MSTILITGATGFLGSSLAASLLAEGTRVKALSRQDPAGDRVRAAVDKAAKGFGLSLRDEHRALLSTVEVDFRDLPGTLPPNVFDGVTAVWNVAAEMSYSLKKILQSVEQNVLASTALYALSARHARQCQRFYHVSTAYTAGFGGVEAHEVVHSTPHLINAYQLSKWMAEVNLLQAQRERGLALTLFRPSVIIGHRESGWSSGAPFGLFSFAEGLLGARRLGAGSLQVDLNRQARLNLVCVDTVARRAQALTRRGAGRLPVEIFHCVGDELFEMEPLLELLGRLLGMHVALGPPRGPEDAEFNRVVEKNKPFADRTWHFHADQLKKVLGDAYGPQPMSQELVRRSVAHFLEHRLQQLAGEAVPPPSPRLRPEDAGLQVRTP